MKRIFSVILLLAMLCVLPNSVTAAEEQPERFSWLTSSDTLSFYLDTERIELFQGQDTANKEIVLDIWLKEIPTQEYRETTAEWYRQHGDDLLTNEHLELGYMLHHVQLSTNMKFKNIASYYIRKDGTHKYSRIESNQWEAIIPQSPFETITVQSFFYLRDHREKAILKNNKQATLNAGTDLVREKN